jgi:hypothetical protein
MVKLLAERASRLPLLFETPFAGPRRDLRGYGFTFTVAQPFAGIENCSFLPASDTV